MLRLFYDNLKLNESLSDDFLQTTFNLLKDNGVRLANLSWRDLGKYLNQYFSERKINPDDLGNDVNNIDLEDIKTWFSGRRLRRSNEQIFSALKQMLEPYTDSNLSKLSPDLISRILKIYAKDNGYNYNDLFTYFDTQLDVQDFVDWFDLSGTTGNFLFEFGGYDGDKTPLKVTDFIELAKLDDLMVKVIKYFAVKHNLATPDLKEITTDKDYKGRKVSFETLCNWVLSDFNSINDPDYNPDVDERKQAEVDVIHDYVSNLLNDSDPEFNTYLDSKKDKLIKEYIKTNKDSIEEYKLTPEYKDKVEEYFQKNLKYPRSPESEKDYIDPEFYNSTLEELEDIYKNPPKDFNTLVVESLNEDDGGVIEVEDSVEVQPDKIVDYEEDAIKSGTKDLVNQLMTDAWAFISKVNSGVVTIKSEFEGSERDSILEILNSVADDATIIVGMLSKASTLLDNRSLEFMLKGEKKADQIISK